MSLQIPAVEDRYHFVRARAMVHEHGDGRMSVYHGKRRLGRYDKEGRLKNKGGKSRPRTRIGGPRSFTSASSGYALLSFLTPESSSRVGRNTLKKSKELFKKGNHF